MVHQWACIWSVRNGRGGLRGVWHCVTARSIEMTSDLYVRQLDD